MTQHKLDYIAGDWVDGEDAVENRNPYDVADLVGCFVQASVQQLDAALATANDTPYGLTSGIVTRSLARATHFRRNLRTGCVAVNLPTAGTDYHVPFGICGESSYSPREQGTYAIEFYTTVKTAYVAAGTPE